jgi:hypothetical protein
MNFEDGKSMSFASVMTPLDGKDATPPWNVKKQKELSKT